HLGPEAALGACCRHQPAVADASWNARGRGGESVRGRFAASTFRLEADALQQFASHGQRLLGALAHLLDLFEPLAVAEDLRLPGARSEEHTSELQSREKLVCRL